VAKVCNICGRRKGKYRERGQYFPDPNHSKLGLCNMANLTDGRIVHVNRIDRLDGDVRAQIDKGEVKVARRWWTKKETEEEDS